MEDANERADQARRGSPFLTTAQAAHYLGVSERTLQRLRASGAGPAARRHARVVQYHIDDLQAWSAATANGRES